MAQVVGMTVPSLRTNPYSGIIMSPLKHLAYKSSPLAARHSFKSLTLFCYTVVVVKTFAAPSVNSMTFFIFFFIFTDSVSFETSFLLHHRCLFLLAVSHARSTPVHFWHHFGLLSLGRPPLPLSLSHLALSGDVTIDLQHALGCCREELRYRVHTDPQNINQSYSNGEMKQMLLEGAAVVAAVLLLCGH